MLQKIKDFFFKNNTTRQTVAKNTFWLSVSNFGGRLIKAIIIIYAARALGTVGYGVFSYALTLAGFLTLFMDPGINSILIRDASKAGEEERQKIFGTTLVIKIVLIALSILLIIFIAPLFTTLNGARALLPIVAFILALDTAREFFFSVIRSMEEMQKEAAIFLLTNLGIVIFGFLFLRIALTAKSFGWGYVVGDALGSIGALIVVRRHFKNAFSHFSREMVLPILKAAWPFAISGALGLLFTNTDILIISWMRSASEVGIYSAAIRIVQTLYLVPGIIQFTTLPLLARLAKTDNNKFRSALEQTLGLVFIASIPLAIGGIVLGTPIIGFLFGSSYQPGGMAFKILMATLLFDFPASIIINALFAYDHQKSLIVSSALGGVINVVFDLLFIPRWGITGSAVATLLAQAINNGYLWYAMKTVTPFSVIHNLVKISAASVIMGICAALFLFAGVNLIVNIAICAVIYLLMLKLLREPMLGEFMRVITRTA